MAIVPQQGLVVIRDTLKNKIMPGAKDQMAFDSKGRARRSLVHAGWWSQAARHETLRELMPNGNMIVDAREQIKEELNRQGWRNRDQQLVAEFSRIEDEIRQFTRGNTEYSKTVSAYKFDKQTRYVIELLVNIETQEIK